MIADQLTVRRLHSYLSVAGGDSEAAIRLYDWNIRVAGSLYEDLGRLEIVFRNTIDAALVAHGSSQGWPTVWYGRCQLFPRNTRAWKDVDTAAAGPRGMVGTRRTTR